MIVPEITYQFTAPTDVAGPTFEIFARVERQSAANIFLQFSANDLPKDRIFVFSNATLFGTPEATQNIEEMFIQISTQTGVLMNVVSDFEVEAAGIEKSLNWAGQVYVQGAGPDTQFLRAGVLFDAGAQVNTAEISWQGIVIPHGNAGAF